MKVKLERNTGHDSMANPYSIELEVVHSTIDAGSVFNIPVALGYTISGKKKFTAEICGFHVEADTPNEMPSLVGRLAFNLIRLSRFPSYVFIAREAGEVYPVYTQGNEVFATTPGGPIFSHVELAKVREYLSDYLNTVGIIGEEGVDDKLHVRGVNLHTLGLRRPILYLKKRVPDQIDFWAPVFESGDGQKIYTYAASKRRQVPNSDGKEVLALREEVARALKADGRLQNQFDLRPDRLMPERWQRLQTTLMSQGAINVNGQHLDLYNLDNLWIAVEPREDEDRYGLFVGSSMEDVLDRVKVDYDRREIGMETAVVS